MMMAKALSLLGDDPTPLLALQVYTPSLSTLTVESKVSTDDTVKLDPGVFSVVKLAEGPIQEIVCTGLPCAVQLNAAGIDCIIVRSSGRFQMKGWADVNKDRRVRMVVNTTGDVQVNRHGCWRSGNR